MRSNLKPATLFILSLLLLSSSMGRTRKSVDDATLINDRANPRMGRLIDMSPSALIKDYREAAMMPGLGAENAFAPIWQVNDIRTDSVDLGWINEYGSGSMPSTDVLTGITTDAAGNVFVTGNSDFEWLTIKYDASGNLVWSQTYTEDGIVDTYGDDVLVDDAGNVYVSGYRWSPFIDSDILVIKYDPSGVQQWVAEYAGEGLNNDFPNDMELDALGNIFIGGYSYSAAVEADFATLKFDNDGNLLWDMLFNGSAWADDWITDITLDDSGNVYVAGITTGETTNNDYGIIKYSADGIQVWSTQFDGITGTDVATSIAVDSQGQTYVTGVSQYYDDYFDYYTLKYDSAGSQIWGIRRGISGEGDSWASDIVVDDSLNVTVTGLSYGGLYGFDYTTVQWDSTGTESWASSYTNNLFGGYDEATSLILDSENNVIVTGITESNNQTTDIVTVKYDTAGVEMWSTLFDGGEGVDDVAFYLALDMDDDVLVGGIASSILNLENYSILKYQADGTETWNTQYDGPGNSLDLGVGIATDGYSNAYVTGIIMNPSNGADISIIKYDSTGLLVWSSEYNGAGNSHDVARDILTDSEGNILITGYTEGLNGDRDIITLKYSAAGDQLWATTYDGPGNNDDEAMKLLVDSNGHVYVTGFSTGSLTNYDYTTIKYDGLGNETWVARYVGPNYGSDIAVDLVLDDDENLYVTGGSFRTGFNIDYTTVKYDMFGSEEWVVRYNGAVNSNDYATAIDLDPAGNIYVTGYTIGAALNDDITTIKYTPGGNQIWVRDFDGEANFKDQASHISVDNRGGVVVSGSSYGLTGGKDFVTLKYNSVGDLLWTNTYDGGGQGDDQLQSMTRDGTGAIYVTGQSLSETGSFDVTTLKYSEAGEQLWKKHFTGGGYSYDDPSDIVVDLRGTVWVTGSTHYFLLGDYDWGYALTIQYLQNLYPVSIGPELPVSYALDQNYPNPFNPQTTLQYQIPEVQDVSLVIYNIQGQEVATVSAGYKLAGMYSLEWDARDQRGEMVSTGVYFCRLQAGEFSQTIKMIYLK
ncbi:MAG: SBBP repeat-containing protein [Candidatus Marinimicrobia bacterium]|nr:SBBP repeat-containing protein [Candidatus Neomarinimicrobiota bacterium]